ncbi:MAG: hypothetical protein M3409_10000 [Gemmatimonadota bacterium]|jgi:hypothetical protein|nr:hypothetical protein [Gemmatimonadota bacterium]
MLLQIVSLLGAALLLGAFAANARGRMGHRDPLYNALNFVGAVLLGWVAVADGRWGFIILETVWALVALAGLLRPPRVGPAA